MHQARHALGRESGFHPLKLPEAHPHGPRPLDIANPALPRGLEQPLSGVVGGGIPAATVVVEPEAPKDREAARRVVELIDDLSRAQVQSLHRRRCGVVQRDERRAERDARVERLVQRLPRLRQLLEERQRLLEEPDGLSVR